MTRLTREELEKIIDENPLRSLSSIGEETGNSRVAIEKRSEERRVGKEC